jgi:hypothetical protein
VTTLVGSATSTQQFTYVAPTVTPITAPAPIVRSCTVPNLRRKKLKAAKKAIVAADCKVGTVTKAKGVTAKSGKVAKQSPKPGTTKAAGAKVSFKLG